MALDVIGAGFGRTGTLSLKVALEQLGFRKCYHMIEVFEHPEHIPLWAAAHRGEPIDWDALFQGYRASVDWPSCNLWREQLARFPGAKVILSTRDPERWYESVMNTIYPSSRAAADAADPQRRAFGQWAMTVIWDGVFGGRMEDRAHVIGCYEKHVETVLREAPADRLLVFEAAQGWSPLCAFLEVPVPDTPYPRTNSTEEFLANSGVKGPEQTP
ncbi:MAG: sulfotransferase family protein [Pseudomonadales bacterium]|jgi:hypothetical protein|nr:sulfotransferase family protein [Pseudomonadales bacterium]